MTKLALNLLVRNCADFIENALNSVYGQVDYIVVGFGGSSEDETEKVIKDWLRTRSVPHSTIQIPWEDDFSKARNAILEETIKTFPDADWMFWMDADDTLVVNDTTLKDIITVNPTSHCIQMPYVYQRSQSGDIMVWHTRERLVYLPDGWTWVRPVHETLQSFVPQHIVQTEKARLEHDESRSAGVRTDRNRKILLKYLEDNPSDKRTLLYLGHVCYSNEEWEEGLNWFASYFQTPTNFVEQWSAAIFAGRCALAMEQWEEASGWFHEAIDIRPEWKDGYLGLAFAHTKLGNVEAAIQFFKEVDAKEKPPNILFIVEQEYTWNRWCYEHEALAKAERYEEAFAITSKALEVDPTHAGFIYYHFAYAEAIDAKKNIEGIQQLCYTLLRRGDGIKALTFLDTCVPSNLEEEPKLAELREFIASCVEQVWNPEIMQFLNESGNSKLETLNRSKKQVFEHVESFARVRELDRLLQPHLARAKELERPLRIIDFACAAGGIPMYFADKYDVEVLGIDSDKKAIDIATQNAKKWGLNKKVKFKVSNIIDVDPSEVGEFDVALMQEVLEHTDKPALMLGTACEIAPVVFATTPNQHVVTPNDGLIKNPRTGAPLHGHVIEFSRRGMERLGMMSGFAVENLYSVFAELGEAPVPKFGSWVLELQAKTKPLLPVVIYCGQSGGEEWTPRQIDAAGLGGSETAAIRVATEFSRLGHPVFVYGTTNGVYDGVVYRTANKFKPNGPAGGNKAWLFVASRIPEIIDQEINASVKMLWCHDNTFKARGSTITPQLYERLTPERAEKFDKILVLSKWAKGFMKEQYPFVSDDKWVVTKNGISVENFTQDEAPERKKHSFIWSSSLDRGLERVLKIWPKIKKMWKDAELDIFYGLDVMEKIHGQIPEVQEFMNKILIEADQPGVNFKGRIGQKSLSEEYKKHHFWLYPTAFEETFCIVAEEAQAAGCIPCTTSVAALKERVPEEYRLDWKNGTEFVTKLKQLAQLEKLPSKYRKEALTYTWESVVDQWSKLTTKVIRDANNETTSGKSEAHKEAVAV